MAGGAVDVAGPGQEPGSDGVGVDRCAGPVPDGVVGEAGQLFWDRPRPHQVQTL